MARGLLLVTALLLMSAPWTQHIWTWDRFLHGGQDFESGALAILVTLCMVFLLAQSCKQRVVTLLAACRLFFHVRTDSIWNRTTRSERTMAWLCARGARQASGAYNLALQI
jgi:hypothetical protein